MMVPVESVSIYCCPKPVDFRKGIYALATFVEGELGEALFSQTLFLFTNRQYNRVRILYWDQTGFCLWTKVLEQSRFHWPHRESLRYLTTEQLRWLLSGVDIEQINPHPALSYQSVL